MASLPLPLSEDKEAFIPVQSLIAAFLFPVLAVTDEPLASLRIVTGLPAPGTGIQEKLEALFGGARFPA